MPGICFINQYKSIASIIIVKMEINEYVTRKNISTESHLIFFLSVLINMLEFNSNFVSDKNLETLPNSFSPTSMNESQLKSMGIFPSKSRGFGLELPAIF